MKEKGIYCQHNPSVIGKASTAGITLVALVVTIVVLLILAGITINYVIGDNSVFSQAQQAKLEYEKSKAREKIEITFGHAQILKHTEPKYNQDDYLDELMKSEISNIKIKGDVVIVDGFAFEIDRSVPKIGQYLGKEEDLVFPDITATVTIATDNKTATIHITAKEATNGISKIEVIQEGHVIETYTYDNKKEQITEDYEVKQNGTYIIKAYAKLTENVAVEVDSIVMSMEYIPNGSNEYKKEHQVKVMVSETDDKVKNIKYQWLNTTVEPDKSTFTETCENGETLTKNGVTGSYYLWTLLETEKGKTRIERSERFNFDNQGPNVTLTSTPVSATSFTLNATATDNYSGIKQYEFYVNGSLKNTQTTSATSASYNVTGVSTGNTNCYVIVSDGLGNTTKRTVTGKTKLYTWERYNVVETTIYKEVSSTSKMTLCAKCVYWMYRSYNFNSQTGKFTGDGLNCSICVVSWVSSRGYRVSSSEVCTISGDYKYANNQYTVNVTKITSKPETTYSKGTTKYSDVTGTSSTAYPSGRSGTYWYVYKGEY